MSGVIKAKDAKDIRAEVLRKRKEGIKLNYPAWSRHICSIAQHRLNWLERKRGQRGFNLGNSYKDHSVPFIRSVYTALKKEAIEMLKKMPIESDGKEYDPDWQEHFCRHHDLHSAEVDRYVKLKGCK